MNESFNFTYGMFNITEYSKAEISDIGYIYTYCNHYMIQNPFHIFCFLAVISSVIIYYDLRGMHDRDYEFIVALVAYSTLLLSIIMIVVMWGSYWKI